MSRRNSWTPSAGYPIFLIRNSMEIWEGVRGKPREIMRTVPSADCQVLESIAREVVARRANGESLRMISQRMNVKLGTVRSVLSRDRSPTPETSLPSPIGAEGA